MSQPPNNQWQQQAGSQPPQNWQQQAGSQPPQQYPPQNWQQQAGSQPPQNWPQQPWPQQYPPQQWPQQPPNQWGQYNSYNPQAPCYGPPPGAPGAPPPQGFNSTPYGQPPMPNASVPNRQGGAMPNRPVESDNAFQKTKFYGAVSHLLHRDYTIILDKSGSMAGERWKQAKEAVSKLAPFACKADPDGITLYLFSSPTQNHPKFQNIRDPQAVNEIFSKQSPSGTTDLTGVLRQAFKEHFSKKPPTPTTILVITDGVPNDKNTVAQEIKDASNRIQKDDDLSVTFVQIGNDAQATQYLINLDDNLSGCKFDIVDRVTSQEMNGMSFSQLIAKSIMD